MKTIINLFFLIVLLHIFLAGCSTSSSNEDGIDAGIDGGTEESEESEESEEDTDTTAPILSEVTAVTTPSTDSTPNYTFS